MSGMQRTCSLKFRTTEPSNNTTTNKLITTANKLIVCVYTVMSFSQKMPFLLDSRHALYIVWPAIKHYILEKSNKK
jgi:hypothetical protein